MTKKWLSTWLVALGCLGVFVVAVAAEPNPSGTVNINSKTVAIGVGVSWGDGTLNYQGKTYTFSVGEVFNLNNVADFSGNYAAGEAGIAIAGGPSDTIMKNDKGVVIRLHGTQQGGRLTLAAQGVKLQLK